MILDAVFGIGLSRNVEGAYKKLIDWINRNEDMKTIAVDIPSGISSDTGEVMGDAVRADVTVTFGMKKLGQVLFPGREYCGELLVRDVGFVPESSAEQEKHVQMLDREDLLRIPARTPDSNKGTYGKVLVMAGAKNMAGAACLSARAAYRMGAGLVKIFTPEENRIIVQEKLPEAILSTYDAREAGKDPESFARKIARETECLQAVISQQLIPDVDGRNIPVFEIMRLTPAIRNMIRDNKVHQIEGVISTSGQEQMRSMDQSLLELYKKGRITRDTALKYALNADMLKRRLM